MLSVWYLQLITLQIMWVILSLALSGIMVGIGVLLKYTYYHRLKKYKKISEYRPNKKTKEDTSDGYVFVCVNDKKVNQSAPHPELNDPVIAMLNHDPDCELIEELDKMVPTS